MPATKFDWSSLITRVTDEIPTDVTFNIADGDITGQVEAHKMVMAMVSLPFAKMFFTADTLEKTAKEIEIKETTKPSFQIMVDVVYSKTTIEDSLRDKSVDEVFAVANIVASLLHAQL